MKKIRNKPCDSVGGMFQQSKQHALDLPWAIFDEVGQGYPKCAHHVDHLLQIHKRFKAI